jgi:ligand-binding sensor domain-containing protein/signal transduction histidine kinase
MAIVRWILPLTGLLLWPLAPATTAEEATRNAGRFSIEPWTDEKGLPENSVVAMTQTRDGYLWLGTLSGLARFDGSQFTVFDEVNTPGLGSSRIVSLFEDSEGTLWIGTDTAGIYQAREGKLSRFEGLGGAGPAGRLVSICQDSLGAIWLCTAGGELARYLNGNVDVWRADPWMIWINFRAVIAEPSGRVWVGTDSSLFAVSPAAVATKRKLTEESRENLRPDLLLASRSGGHWRLANGRIQKWTTNSTPQDFGSYPWDREVRVTAACEDREGNLVVGTLGSGVFWFNSHDKVVSLSKSNGLSHDYVLSLLVDSQGTLWVGTDGGGVNRVKRRVFEVIDECRGWVVQSVAEDAEGGLWIGSNKNGIGRLKNGEFQRFPVGREGFRENVRRILVDRSNTVWAGTWEDGLTRFQDGELQQVGAQIHLFARAIHQDRNQRLWLGTSHGLVRMDGLRWKKFTTADGLAADAVQALADDAEGNLWIGTVGGGLNRWRDDQFTVYRKADGLPSDEISALLADSDGALWIGTFGSGLARFHKGHWTRYTKRDGLVSNSVTYLIDDDEGTLWIGSMAGLMRVSKQALNLFAEGSTRFLPCRTYGSADGLPSGECTLGTACRSRDGRLWFPTISGLASVLPSMLKTNPFAPPVIIESVLLEGEEAHSIGLRARLPAAVTIPAGNERLEIHYTGLNLGAPEQARFRYRLEGHESAWTEVGDSRVARYSKLPPGNYLFRVAACNEDGVWSQTGGVLALLVQPPFWKTWWFLSGTTVCLLAALLGIFYYVATQKLQRQLEGMRQKEALERDRARIARDLHDQLGASMTQVSLLAEMAGSDKDVPEEVEAHAKQITQTARETTRVLDEIVWAVNPSNDTLDALVTYVSKYAQDYFSVAGVRYRLDVPGELPPDPIAPEVRHNVFLAFKEAVTNVVRHAGASSAWIRLKLEPPGFTLEIEDDGRGLAAMDERKGRNGLRNMRGRMEDVGGSFSIRPGSERGAIVRLTAPLPKR